MQYWRLGAVVIIASLLSAVCIGQSSRSELGREVDRVASENRFGSGNYFFGTSPDSEVGTLAWLLYFDKAHQRGQVFIAPAMVNLSEFSLGTDGTLMFQTHDCVGGGYRFIGTLKAEELMGEMRLVDTGSVKKYRWEITAAQLPPQNAHANAEHLVLPGRYSSRYYSDEGGDLVGVDIWFFSTSKGTKGMIVFYDFHEGYWDEPTFTPLALTQVEMDKGIIRFAADTAKGVIHYHLVSTHKGGLFYRDDAPHEKSEKGIALKKYRTVFP